MFSRLLVFTLCTSIAATGAILDVPFVRQQRQGCGPAVIAMLTQYWSGMGVHVQPEWLSPRRIYATLYDDRSGGASGEALAGFLRDRGFQAFAVKADWRDVTANIGRGRPVILALLPAPRRPFHFVLVVGLETGGRDVVIHDPTRGAYLRMPADLLQQQWEGSGRWALIAAPQELP